MPKQKKIPLRTCTGCGQVKPKQDLIRVVHTPEGKTVVDLSGKVSGRGAYLCYDESCFSKATRRKRIAKSLRVEGALLELDELEKAFLACVRTKTKS